MNFPSVRLPRQFVAKALPPLGRDLMVEVGAIPEPTRRERAIQLAEELLRTLYPQSFKQEQ